MRNFYFSLLCICFVFCGVSQSQAQKLMYGGQLKDGTLGEPIIGANIIVQGTTVGTTSNVDGSFQISANEGDVLAISYLGYQDLSIELGKTQMLGIINLSDDSDLLEEVVVVGYGVQKKASSVGAISTTSGDNIVKAGVTGTISEALQGQMSGVVSISTTSQPGESEASIFIRGKSTWDNASPLVLVDGVERDFNDVDANEIESISVLKDASATAVYGVKGANGVILLTTKRGDSSKPKISFSQNFGFDVLSQSPDFSDYVTSMKQYNRAQANDQNWAGLIPQSTITAWEGAYESGDYGPYNDVFPEVDWWDEVVKDFGFKNTTNVNVQGGSDKVHYFVSLGYYYNSGIYDSYEVEDYDTTYDYDRYNWRSNLDFKITKTTSLSVNIAGSMGISNRYAIRGDSDGAFSFGRVISNPTNEFPIKYSDGAWGDGAGSEQNVVQLFSMSGNRQYKKMNGFYDLAFKQDLGMVTKGLSFNAKISYTTNNYLTTELLRGNGMLGLNELTAYQQATGIRYNRVYDYSNPVYGADGSVTYPLASEVRFPDADATGMLPVSASYDELGTYTRDLYYELNLNYARTFNNHTVTGLLVFNRRMDQAKAGFPSYEEDWVGRVTYNFRDKYLFEANGAYTGSEKFAPGKRFGFFPSASIGWRISEEPWVKELTQDKLTNLKVRYSYGVVGNDRGASRFNYIQEFNPLDKNAFFGLEDKVAWGPMYTEGDLGDADATWETATKQNLGIEIGLFNKLSVAVDLFDEKREGILMTRNSIPSWADSGVGFPEVNLGETKSHGFEIEASYNNRIGPNFTYFARYAFSASENRVVYRDDAADMDEYLKKAGKPIGYSSKYLTTGNFGSVDDIYNSAQSQIKNGLHNTLIPEDLYYIDYNGDGVITSMDIAPVDELSYPLTTQSLTLGFNYKSIGFSMMWYNAMDVYKEQIDSYLWDFPTNSIKTQPNTWEAGVGGAGATAPSLHLNNDYNQSASTYSYSDHAYIRLKNIEVNYSFPERITSRLFMSSLQVYANGNNVFTFSPCDNRRDPETGGSDVYPMVKSFNIGVRIGF